MPPARRNKAGKAASSDSNGSDSDSDSGHAISKGKADKKAPEGYNWAALCFLFLFASVPIFTAGQYAFDYMYPEAANERRIYDNVYKCYNAIGDVDKINSIDRFIKKYDGKERSLYAQLRAKYGEEFPECEQFRM